MSPNLFKPSATCRLQTIAPADSLSLVTKAACGSCFSLAAILSPRRQDESQHPKGAIKPDVETVLTVLQVA